MGVQRPRTGQELSRRVIEAVASAEGVDPLDLSEHLHSAVNPDALDTLFRGDSGFTSFRYMGYEVTAHWDGNVELEPRHVD